MMCFIVESGSVCVFYLRDCKSTCIRLSMCVCMGMRDMCVCVCGCVRVCASVVVQNNTAAGWLNTSGGSIRNTEGRPLVKDERLFWEGVSVCVFECVCVCLCVCVCVFVCECVSV